jgi:hypothetical protein
MPLGRIGGVVVDWPQNGEVGKTVTATIAQVRIIMREREKGRTREQAAASDMAPGAQAGSRAKSAASLHTDEHLATPEQAPVQTGKTSILPHKPEPVLSQSR